MERLSHSGSSVVGEAATADEAISVAEQLRPDVVIMDLHTPGVGGIKATRRHIVERHSEDDGAEKRPERARRPGLPVTSG